MLLCDSVSRMASEGEGPVCHLLLLRLALKGSNILQWFHVILVQEEFIELRRWRADRKWFMFYRGKIDTL